LFLFRRWGKLIVGEGGYSSKVKKANNRRGKVTVEEKALYSGCLDGDYTSE
jgi:hypothetical protein